MRLLSVGNGMAIVGDSQGEAMFSSLGCMLGDEIKNRTEVLEKSWWMPRVYTLANGARVEYAMSKVGVSTVNMKVILPHENLSIRQFRVFNLKVGAAVSFV
jgi:hypothetical protein